MKLRYMIFMLISHGLMLQTMGTKISWERPVSPDEAEILAKKLQNEGFEDDRLKERILKESRVPESVVCKFTAEYAPWTDIADQDALKPYAERTKQFKKAYAQEKKTDRAKRAQIQAEKEREQKLEVIRKKIAARKLLNAYRENFINPRSDQFSKDLKKLAAQDYTKFKKLICTNEYLTKTDWLYQFLEKINNKKIFQRNADGTLNPDLLEKNISADWINDKIQNLLEDFQSSVYEVFIDTAVNQINNHHMSWIDAVSIPAPEGSYGFAKQTPQYPIAYYSTVLDRKILILGEILNHVIASFVSKKIASSTPEEEIIYTNLNPDNPDAYEYKFSYQNEDIEYIFDFNPECGFDPECDCDHCKSCQDAAELSLLKNFERALFWYFKGKIEEYFNSFGYNQEVSEAFSSHKKPTEPELPERQISDTNKSYNKKYLEYLKEFNAFPDKLLEWQQSHINWRQAADEIFFLGHLVIDKNLEALKALGGDNWLSEQPDWIQALIIEIIENIKNPEPKKRFKVKTGKQSKTQTTKRK